MWVQGSRKKISCQPEKELTPGIGFAGKCTCLPALKKPLETLTPFQASAPSPHLRLSAFPAFAAFRGKNLRVLPDSCF